MSAAARVLCMIGLAALAAGCGRGTANTSAPANSAAPTEIETLPSDESDATPGDELANGDDEADANTNLATANADALQD